MRPDSAILQLSSVCALALALSAASSAHAAESEQKTWSDGIYTYDNSPPLEGYFVPRSVFKYDLPHDVPLEKILAKSRQMTPAELRNYQGGGEQQVTVDYPLFVFKNHSLNVFLWKGKHDRQQQIFPCAWLGKQWQTDGYSQGLADAIQYFFYVSGDHERCYIMLSEQNGAISQDPIHTDQIFFGAFPSTHAVLQKWMETSAAVVYCPGGEAHLVGESMDCLAGQITVSEFRKLPGAKQITYDTIVRITGTGQERKIGATCQGRSFQGDYGRLMVVAKAGESLLPSDWGLGVKPLRWELAKLAAEGPDKNARCCLRLVNPQIPHDEWAILELAVGAEQPGMLYRMPMARHQRDGGDPLVGFEVRAKEAKADLVPSGRFGQTSLQMTTPEENETLGIDYYFIQCGDGVLKLALRAKRYPWEGTVRAWYNLRWQFPAQTNSSDYSDTVEVRLK